LSTENLTPLLKEVKTVVAASNKHNVLPQKKKEHLAKLNGHTAHNDVSSEKLIIAKTNTDKKLAKASAVKKTPVKKVAKKILK